MGLAALLDELTAAVPKRERAAAGELAARVAQRRFRVLVVGEAKRGKSSLVNALLGRPVLPVGVTPVTALSTQIRHGAPDRVDVTYRDGRCATAPLSALADLVTEQGNPGNRCGVAIATAFVDAPLLAGGVELVDTPGVGSVFAHNSAEATAALDTMDAAVLVLSADPPISASERDLLALVRARSVALFVVLNKVDLLDAAGRVEAQRFTTDVIADADGGPVSAYPVSARRALAARQGGDPAAVVASGLAELEEALGRYLATGRQTDLARSVAGHAHRIAVRCLDEALLTVRAVQLAASDAAGSVARFRRHLDGLDERRRDATDVIRASAARLLADLDDAARWDAARLTGEVRTQLVGYLDGPLAGADADRVAVDGRGFAVARTRELVDRWRHERQLVLDEGLAVLDARLAQGIARELDAVRDAARHLLGVDLAVPAPAGSPLPRVAADYDLAEPIDQIELLAGPIRRILPGRWGRRVARRHLLDELELLVPKQVGRTRARFQQALQQATQTLVRAMEARYTEALAGLMAALDAAGDLAGATAGQAAARRAELDARITALRRLAGQLADAASPPAIVPAGDVAPC